MSDGFDDGIDSYVDEGIAGYGTVASIADVSTIPSAAPSPIPQAAPQIQQQAAPRPQPAPPPPQRPRQPTQNFAPPLPRTGPMVSVLFRGLGDFDLAGRCAIVALSRVAWLFWSKVSDGQTTVALGVLELYRSLWNFKRDAIASGFIGHGIEHLPGILPAAQWSQDMRYAMAYSIAGATGFQTDIANVLARMPDSMASLPPWFATLASTLPVADLPSARTYVDAPLPTSGDPIVYYANYVRDDLSQCGTPATTTAPAPAPTQYYASSSAPQTFVPTLAPGTPGGSDAPGTGGPGSPAPSSGGGGGIALVIMLAILGYGGYLAFQDSKPKEKEA